MSGPDPALSPAFRSPWRLPALSGALLGASYLTGPWLVLSFTAFLPLLAWLDESPEAGRYAGLKAGFVFGLLVNLIALHFMYAMLDWSWLASLLYLGTAIALGLRVALAVWLMGWLRRRTGLSWALLLPLCWLPSEWAQTWGDLRMTGDHLAHTVAAYPFLIQFADLVGPYGVTAFLLVSNGLLFESARGWRQPAGRRALAVLVALVTLVVAYDAWAWTRENDATSTLAVGLVQPNIPLNVKHEASTAGEQWSILTDLTLEAARQGAELIVWPESARPVPLYHTLDRPDSYAMPDVQALARRAGVPILVGVEYATIRGAGDYDLYNAAMLVEADGRLSDDWGAKVYLVPFTEALPFKRLLGKLIEGRGGEWRWVAGGFDPGPRSALFETAGTRVGVLVCYEQLFFDLARGLREDGAELGVVITNDAWFGRSYFQAYQANALRLRAIENRIDYVRVANTGISGFLNSRGQYTLRTKLFEKRVEVREVSLSRTATVYGRFGDVVAWVAIAGLLTAVLLARRSAV